MIENDKILVFIYNADSGAINLVKDFWKKILRPSSYECNLCMQTFGAFKVKKDWKKFIESLKISTEFLHKDEFEKKYNILDADYPSAYLKEKEKFSLLISSDEMNSVNSLDRMEALVLKKIDSLH
jgi:hypothetical protein